MPFAYSNSRLSTTAALHYTVMLLIYQCMSEFRFLAQHVSDCSSPPLRKALWRNQWAHGHDHFNQSSNFWNLTSTPLA